MICTKMGDALAAFNLHGSLTYHVKLLVREVAKDDKVMASAQALMSKMEASLSNVQ